MFRFDEATGEGAYASPPPDASDEPAAITNVATARRSLRELVLAGLGHDLNGDQLDGACRALEMLLDCLSGHEPDFPGALPLD
jgi:hypothetical protein